MNIVLVGLSHKTAPVEIREKFAFPDGNLPHFLKDLVSQRGISEGLILSTCNRVEVSAVTGSAEEGVGQITEFLLRSQALHAGQRVSQEVLSRFLYSYTSEEAIRHILRVASSLDSMVVGEPQILGQLKTAYETARREETTGKVLNKLYQRAISAAKKVRTETRIAENAVSVSFAAVELAKKIFGHLTGKTVLLVGTGEMAILAARHLMASGVSDIMIMSRTMERAEEAARELKGRPVAFTGLSEEITRADIVICSTSAPHHLITPPHIQKAIHVRKNLPVFLIDISVPRNIDPVINDIDNVFLYNIDDLQLVVEANCKGRQKEAHKAEELIAEEVQVISRWVKSLEAVPTIVALKEKAEDIRKEELSKTLTRLPRLTPQEREVIEGLATSLMNKLLHTPLTSLKQKVDSLDGGVYLETVRRLFNLEHHRHHRRSFSIGTRGSPLALYQANWVKARLEEKFPACTVALKRIRTSGDRLRDVPLATAGGKGLFVKEIEEALLKEEIDLAVHSMKDLPVFLPAGLHLAAIPEREDPRDVLVSREGQTLLTLRKGARIGTSSLRRISQIRFFRPDLIVVPLRGNLDTRLKKLHSEGLDAIIVAAAGIKRMGWEDRITEHLSPEVSLPAIGQGALGIECRKDDSVATEQVRALHHEETGLCVSAERAFLGRLGGGCQVPIAAHGRMENGKLVVEGAVFAVDGSRMVRDKVEGEAHAPEELGILLAERLLSMGADEILKDIAHSPRPEPSPP